MVNDRLRIQINDAYSRSLGIAIYCFAMLEWNVIWACERLEPGNLQLLPSETAGVVARRFVKLTSKNSDANTRELLKPLAQEFLRLVGIRNAMAHSNPGTDLQNEQRLFRRGESLTPEALNNAADDFAACSIAVGAFVSPPVQR